MSSWENNDEIEVFREYLRIPSVHPNVDYGKFSDFKLHFATYLNYYITNLGFSLRQCGNKNVTY